MSGCPPISYMYGMKREVAGMSMAIPELPEYFCTIGHPGTC